ncbi:hypothetical protein C2W62_14625 [Candidatus Entotheonella serta]|nr:hypothetical protein C2W62_14625 [Candidatus Entotheonella serta]
MANQKASHITSNDIENPLENVAFAIGYGTIVRFCLQKQWLQNMPLLLTEVLEAVVTEYAIVAH